MQVTRPRQALELTEDESWRLLSSVSLGRIVFTMDAPPAIRPVNHLTDAKTIIIRSHLRAAIVKRAADDGAVVCYEADELDPVRHTGWSVIATGIGPPGPRARRGGPLPAAARAVGGGPDGLRHRHHAPDRHRHPPGRLVPLTYHAA